MRNPAAQKAIVSAALKTTPSDFVVREILPDPTEEDGEHVWLYIQKIGVNTAYLANMLAKTLRLKRVDVGYSGLKDRHAVCCQWFSVRAKNVDLAKLEANLTRQLKAGESARVLQSVRQAKKLKKGVHKNNRFAIVLRKVQGDKDAIDDALTGVAKNGFPNFFGVQRFGRNRQNLKKAALFLQKLPDRRCRQKLSASDALLVSAARSLLFNQILALRLQDGVWDTPLDGDVFALDNARSRFVAKIDDDLKRRAASGQIHPTAPLFGAPSPLGAAGEALEYERRVFDDPKNRLWTEGLARLSVDADRRPLRAMARNLTWQWTDAATLSLDFVLPTGSFATALIDRLTGDFVSDFDAALLA